MSRHLNLIDELAAQGRQEFTFRTAQDALGTSASATANVLRVLAEKGLVDRLNRGHYAIRPFGSLGTSAVTDNLGPSVAAAFEGLEHRVAYLSALAEHSLTSHPVRTIQVACNRQVRFAKIGNRHLQAIIEKPDTIHLETDWLDTSWVSNVHRSLFDAALRVDLVGGSQVLAEAVGRAVDKVDPSAIGRLVRALGSRGRAAERRLASIAHTLDLPLGLEPVVAPSRPIIRLDPRDDHKAWVDRRFRVAWNLTPDEAAGVVTS